MRRHVQPRSVVWLVGYRGQQVAVSQTSEAVVISFIASTSTTVQIGLICVLSARAATPFVTSFYSICSP